VDPDRFGLAVVAADGRTWAAGDASTVFTIMSVVKPFTFALLCEAVGAQEARRCTGSDATGRAFDSAAAVEQSPDGRTNPMVNAGALVAVGGLPGPSVEARWQRTTDGLARFAGRVLTLDHAVYASAVATNSRNRALAHLVGSRGLLGAGADETVELYTRISCLSVDAHDLAVMGAVLADDGVNPVTGERVVGPDTCRAVLAAMTTAGLYATSGDWLQDVGLPGKSGIGGGIITIAPGKGALSTFAPRLDGSGNSVRGQLAARHLSRALGLDVFPSAAGGRPGRSGTRRGLTPPASAAATAPDGLLPCGS